MPTELARKNEGLEAQTQKIMQVFKKAGYEVAAPAIIQTADVFLDVIGEALRARTYVFTDPEGEELCLRPDLTVPTCRYYLEKHQNDTTLERFCYHGPAFRYQPIGMKSPHPREFYQAGIETIGVQEKEQADAKTMAIILEAIKSVGIQGLKVKISDIGIFRALLETLEIPERWRQSLVRFLGRSQNFDTELRKRTENRATILQSIPPDLRKAIDPNDINRSEEAVLQYLSLRGLEANGTRTITEIAQNLMWHLIDTKASPLSMDNLSLINQYLKISGPTGNVTQSLKEFFKRSGIEFIPIIESYQNRLELLSEYGVDVSSIEFSAEFGRQLAYYTGFIFEIITPELGPDAPIAGGGRYDDLMKSIGAKNNIPAVGGAIDTQRLWSLMERETL